MQLLLFAALLLASSHAQFTGAVNYGAGLRQISTSAIEAYPGWVVVPGTSTLSGLFSSQPVNTFTSLFAIGPHIDFALAFNVTGINTSITLTAGWAIRDVTTMPEATLVQFIQTITNGTSLGYVSSPLITGPTLSAAVNTTSDGMLLWMPGSVDSYGNVISGGDTINIDMAMYWTSSAENVNATFTFSSIAFWIVVE